MRSILILIGSFACVGAALGGDCLTLELVGENIDVSSGAVSQRLKPAIAYNSVDDEYVVVWFDTRNPSNNRGYGRRLAADGSPIGGQFFVSNGGFESSLAYNPVDDQFLHQARNFAGGGAGGIRGQRVSSTGGLLGSNFGIATAGAPGPSGQVVFGAVNNLYLATWRDQSNCNLQGQMIATNGSLVGGPILISSSFPESGRAAQQAYDELNDRFLVVFSEFQNANVLGQFISGDGLLMGGNFEIAAGLASRVAPRIAFSGVAGAYAVMWRDGSDLVTQVLADDGAVAGDPLTVAAGTVTGDPSAVYNDGNGEIMVTWPDNRNAGGGEPDIFAQRLVFDCCDPCDMNCDGAIDAFDIEPFLDLLFGGGVPCDACTGDVNGDGRIDAFDIEPFLVCLFG